MTDLRVGDQAGHQVAEVSRDHLVASPWMITSGSGSRSDAHAAVLHGKDGLREGFTKVFGDLPDPQRSVHTRILEGDALFLEWSAESATSQADDGVETFLVRDGEIVLQTVHYTVQRPYDRARGEPGRDPGGASSRSSSGRNGRSSRLSLTWLRRW
jgi:hypothetical protein